MIFDECQLKHLSQVIAALTNVPDVSVPDGLINGSGDQRESRERRSHSGERRDYGDYRHSHDRDRDHGDYYDRDHLLWARLWRCPRYSKVGLAMYFSDSYCRNLLFFEA